MCSSSLLLSLGVEEPTWYSSCVHKQAHAYLGFKNMELRLQRNRKYLDKSSNKR